MQLSTITLILALLGWVSVTGLACAQSPRMVETRPDTYDTLTDRGVRVKSFQVPLDNRWVKAVIALPSEDQLADHPVLLLAIGGPRTHLVGANDLQAKHFLDRGHPVVSFDIGSMPGDLTIYRDNVIKGPDPALVFIREAQAVIRGCEEMGWSTPGRVVVTGISRYGYLALRLLAADDSLHIGGAFSPVTDWRALREFDGFEDRDEVSAMAVSNYIEGLVGKQIFMVIGNHDDRVGTAECAALFVDLHAANQAADIDPAKVDLFLTTDPGHKCSKPWYQLGAQTLLDAALSDTE